MEEYSGKEGDYERRAKSKSPERGVPVPGSTPRPCIRTVCAGVVAQHMRPSTCPTGFPEDTAGHSLTFPHLQAAALVRHARADLRCGLRRHRTAGHFPGIRRRRQSGSGDRHAGGVHQRVRLQGVYGEVGKLYNQSKQGEAEKVLREYAQWLGGFTLKGNAFVDVAETFSERYHRNRQREEAEKANALPQVCRFLYPVSRCPERRPEPAGTGSPVFWPPRAWGKAISPSISAYGPTWTTPCMCCTSRLEGSEEEALNAYSGGLISKNAYYYEQGKIPEGELRRFEELLKSMPGALRCARTRASTRRYRRSTYRAGSRSTAKVARAQSGRGNHRLDGPPDRCRAPQLGCGARAGPSASQWPTT